MLGKFELINEGSFFSSVLPINHQIIAIGLENDKFFADTFYKSNLVNKDFKFKIIPTNDSGVVLTKELNFKCGRETGDNLLGSFSFITKYGNTSILLLRVE